MGQGKLGGINAETSSLEIAPSVIPFHPLYWGGGFVVPLPTPVPMGLLTKGLTS